MIYNISVLGTVLFITIVMIVILVFIGIRVGFYNDIAEYISLVFHSVICLFVMFIAINCIIFNCNDDYKYFKVFGKNVITKNIIIGGNEIMFDLRGEE